MKKFIAALLVVVMVVSCMSFAFADSVNSYDMVDSKGGAKSRWSVKINAAVAETDVISFWVKPATIEGADMYARNSTKAVYLDAEGNETGVEVYSGKSIVDNAIAEADGWYYIECVAKVAADAGVYELSVDCGNVDGGAMEGAQIAGVKLNGVEVEVVNFNDGSALTATAMEEPVPVVEDETEDVEETGVVSVAVVAVAAVVGGAVVLKKREF